MSGYGQYQGGGESASYQGGESASYQGGNQGNYQGGNQGYNQGYNQGGNQGGQGKNKRITHIPIFFCANLSVFLFYRK